MRDEGRPGSGEERPGSGEERPGSGEERLAASKAPLDEPPGGIFPNWRALYLTLFAYTGLAVLVLLVLTHLMNAGEP